jgi:hypothetical protein
LDENTKELVPGDVEGGLPDGLRLGDVVELVFAGSLVVGALELS